MTDEYRDVPNGYVYLYEQQGWEVVSRGDFTTRMVKTIDEDIPDRRSVATVGGLCGNRWIGSIRNAAFFRLASASLAS